MEPLEQEEAPNDMIIATGIDIEDDEEEYEHHESFKRGTRKASR